MTIKTNVQAQGRTEEKELPDSNETKQILDKNDGIYRQLIEFSHNAMSVAKDGRRIYANKRFLELFGYDHPNEVLDKHLTMVVHPDDHEMVCDYSDGILKGEEIPSSYRFKGIRKNGETISIEVLTIRIFVKQEPVLLDILRNVTQFKGVEKGPMQKEKTETTGKIDRSLAHKFNNLLAIVLGNIAIVKEMDQNGIGIEPFLNEAETAAKKVRDLVKGLSCFTKGKRTVKK